MPLIFRVTACLPWLIPAGLFLASGLSKLLAPVGTAPLVVNGVMDRIPYTTLLRCLGVVEVCLAAPVFAPRYRRAALLSIVAALAVFTLFVAFSAADLQFIGNCGCFGVLDPTRTHSARYFGWLVLRNALIALLAAIGAFRHSRDGTAAAQRLGALVARAGLVAAFLLVVSMAIGEARLRVASYETLGALAEADERFGFLGQTFPSIALTDEAGERTSSDVALHTDDHIFFLSATCGHCRSLGPDLCRYDEALRVTGRRVVLIVIEEQQVPAGFLEEIGCKGMVAFATSDPAALLRLGITMVPALIVLGNERQVAYNEAFPTPPTICKSVELGARRIPGFSNLIWDAVARGVFGGQARCAEPPAVVNGLHQAEIVGTAEEGLRLYAVVEGARLGEVLELAVGIDHRGNIRGIVPLAAGAFIRVVDPSASLVDHLVGMTLAEAMATARQRSELPAIEQRIWRAVGQALARIEEARRS